MYAYLACLVVPSPQLDVQSYNVAVVCVEVRVLIQLRSISFANYHHGGHWQAARVELYRSLWPYPSLLPVVQLCVVPLRTIFYNLTYRQYSLVPVFGEYATPTGAL